jgi:hypothetical protein
VSSESYSSSVSPSNPVIVFMFNVFSDYAVV